MFRITYLNILDGKRHTLIDEVDQEQVDGILATFGNPNDPSYYMPGMEVEPME